MDILRALTESAARIPKTQRPAAEPLMAGYYRICYTDNLIIGVIGKCYTERDLNFWRQASIDEQGHADLYRADLEDLFGDEFRGFIHAFKPCPEILSLFAWIGHSPMRLGVYRAYLENALLQATDEERSVIETVLPRTTRTHFDLDPYHIKECEEYLSSFREDQITECIAVVENALIQESRWHGLSH